MKWRASMFVLAAFLSFTQQAQAAENPTGTWKWTMTFNNQTREVSLTLKLEGDKLTGSMPGRNNTERQIENGTFVNDEVKFDINRERNGQKFTQTYKGKVSGNTIKGTIEFQRDGLQTRPWEAKRAP